MRHFLALSLVAVLLIGLPAQAQDAASPTVPDSFETLTADWTEVRLSLSYPENWTAFDLSEKTNLAVIELSRKKETARKRWSGGQHFSAADDRPALRLFGADNASVFVIGGALVTGFSDSAAPLDLLDAEAEKARLRAPQVVQPATDTVVAGHEGALLAPQGTSRDGYAVRYCSMIFRTDDTVVAAKAVRPVDGGPLSDEMLRTIVGHIRTEPISHQTDQH
jgi:hypothetical protein